MHLCDFHASLKVGFFMADSTLALKRLRFPSLARKPHCMGNTLFIPLALGAITGTISVGRTSPSVIRGLAWVSTNLLVREDFKSENKTEFLKKIKMFTSNSKAYWGGLLTPIVDSVRIKGKVDIKGSILIELSGVLHTSPNYLLGMEEYEEDLLEIITVYKNLKGSETKQIALEQMKLLATMSSEL